MIIEKISKTDNFNTYKVKNNNVFITQSPFSNCQTLSIGGFCCLFDDYKHPDIKKDLKQILIEAGNCKSQLMIDVTDNYNKKIVELFPDSEVIWKQSYINGTGSNMTTWLVRTRNYLK